jgi:hypothetical protein
MTPPKTRWKPRKPAKVRPGTILIPGIPARSRRPAPIMPRTGRPAVTSARPFMWTGNTKK